MKDTAVCPMCEKKCKSLHPIEKADRLFFVFDCKYIKRIIQLDCRLLKPVSFQNQYTFIINDLLNRDTNWLCTYYTLESVCNKSESNDNFVNLANIISWNGYHLEKIDRALMNIYYLFHDEIFRLNTTMGMRCLLCFDNKERDAMEKSLLNFGYITEIESNNESKRYIISKEGWHRIDEIRRKDSEKTGFIAISFKNDTSEIRETIKEAITETGFEPIIINEVEHNNQIVPEIKNQLRKCRFLVMDCSFPNYGAYYEAGIAAGCGKEVIITCSDDKFHDENNRPHFDIAQQSMVIWKDYDELKDKLINRIINTIEGATNPDKQKKQ